MTLFKKITSNIKEEKKYILIPTLLLSPVLYYWIVYSIFEVYKYGKNIPIIAFQHMIIPFSISLFISLIILLPFSIVITRKIQRENCFLTYIKIQFISFLFIFFIIEFLLLIIFLIIP